MAETVLVTGGTGFIAGWCIVELLRRGYAVRTTVRDASKEARVRAAIAAATIDGEAATNIGAIAADGISSGAPSGFGSVTGGLRSSGPSSSGPSSSGPSTGGLRSSGPSGIGGSGGSGFPAFFNTDLTRDAGWDAAVAGCDYILHVASPLGGGQNNSNDAFTGPARDGTLRVLKAALKANVKRVVMTSAAAAARPPLESDRTSDETVWSNPDDPQFDAYRRSKILAERAAWDFMSAAGGGTELATILPGAVFGPVLSGDNLGSVKIIQGLLNGQPKAVPRLGFWIVDVRDLADLHIRAMIAPAAAGQRFIAANEFMWMRDMANTLRAQLGSAAAKVPTRQLPDWLVKLLLPALPNLKGLAPLLGHRFPLSSQKARQILAFAPRPPSTTIVDCAYSLMKMKA
jgi:nucleoside-diphosphate-sugar epimerase